MKNKLELAHEWAMRIGPETNLPLDILADTCFDYAEAMLAENARREDKSRPEVLQDEFEVYWKIAPIDAEWWAMDESGKSHWYLEKPRISPSLPDEWIGGGYDVDQLAPSFNYTGDWKESLRRRPE